MISVLYLITFVTSLRLVILDKDFETVKQPCIVCMSKSLMILTLGFLFVGAMAFTFFAPRNVWVISGVMTLSISGFMLGLFFAWERHKAMLAALQIVYVVVVTIHFYTWWYV